MSRAVTAILYAPGTNCHEETAAALERAGGQSRLVLLRDLVEGKERLENYQAVIIPGGFSFGDHLGAGRIFSTLMVARLREELVKLLDARKPLLGICNGFQVLADAGVLPGRSPGMRSMALLENQSAHFEDRKVRLLVTGERCLWTEGLAGQIVRMPSAHGEGRAHLSADWRRIPLRSVFLFADSRGLPASDYPDNPNGAPESVAGITDDTGTVLGLMPHPERAALPAHYSQDGLKIFENLVKHLKS